MAKMEDFVGFTFNGIHSSELGIIRTSDGDRFNLDLSPTVQDKTVQVPGADGMYYFGSTYTQRQFSIPIAFDSLTEVQFQRLRKVFSTKEPCSLIFDETPYKEYIVKNTGTSSLKYICFPQKEDIPLTSVDQTNPTPRTATKIPTIAVPVTSDVTDWGRVYKGEGTLNFISYEPYGRSVSRFIDYFTKEKYPNKYDWGPSNGKGILEDGKKEDNFFGSRYTNDPNATTAERTSFYKNHPVAFYCPNYGDIDTDWKLVISPGPPNESDHDITRVLNLTVDLCEKATQKVISSLIIDGLKLREGDSNIRINSETNLIEGRVGTTLSGRIYNEYVGGTFFKIPVGEKGKYSIRLTSNNADESKSWFVEVLKYYYLYY